jgi:hypothetical protein
LTTVSLSLEEMPESHLNTLWIAEHRFQFDATCDDCHTVNDPGGISNSSFCSNSGCHAREWNYLQIDTEPVLAQVVPQQQPSERLLPHIPHPLVDNMNCEQCHGPEKVLAYPEDHAEYGQDECLDCHRLAPEVVADQPPTAAAVPADLPPAPAATTIPPINHTLEGNANCLACHAVTSSIAPAPATHATFTTEMCQRCHQLAPEFSTLPAPTETAEAVSTPVQSPTATPAVSTTVEATSSPATPTPAAPATAATPVDSSTPVSPQASIIPHAIQGNENCLACHAVSSTIEPAPPHHAGFAAELCQTCHQPAPAAIDGATDNASESVPRATVAP